MVFTMLAPCSPQTHDVRTTVVVRRPSSRSPAELRRAVDRPGCGRVPLDVRARPWCRRRRSRSTRRQTWAPTRRAASATWRAPRALTGRPGRGRPRRRRPRSRPRRGRRRRAGSAVMAPSTASRSATSSAPWSTPRPRRGVGGRHVRRSSVPSCPPAPVTRTRTRLLSAALQRLPPPPVVPVPRDGGVQGLVEVAVRAPSRAPGPWRVDRVAAVVAEAVLRRTRSSTRRRPDSGQQPLGQLAVGDLVAGRRCCRSRRPRPWRSTRSTPAQLSST